MACELFDYLNVSKFSDVPRCIYERRCRFADSKSVNIQEAAESCQALNDSKDDDLNTVEDLLQEMKIQEFITLRKLN